MKRIVILTGSELRHTFLRKAFALSTNIDVVATYCEGMEKSLRSIAQSHTEDPTDIMMQHVINRERSESDFFLGLVAHAADHSNPLFIPKGEINKSEHADRIMDLDPDLIIAYGCSIIRDPLLSHFKNRFLNVHLGLSPYYRGSATNFWPLVNKEPEFVGATFMHIDAGVDTGEIIHQLRARMFSNDGPHDIGNRLILDMTEVYIQLVHQFDRLVPIGPQLSTANERVYKRNDYDKKAAEQLYLNFNQGLIKKFLNTQEERYLANPIVEQPNSVVG